MRRSQLAIAGAFAILVTCATAQFKVTRQLVLVPATVKDQKGHFVDGLTTDDLTLYDNSVPQRIQMDWSTFPISLVIAVETSRNGAAVLDKFNGSGILFTDLLAAAAGETAVLSYSDHVTVRQNFTADTDAVSHALLRLHGDGDGAAALDAIAQALKMLDGVQPGRRRIIVMIGEERDRYSEAKLADVARNVERQNAAIYWLTYSPFLTAFTDRPHVGDRETAAERRADWRHRDDLVDIPEPAPGDLLSGIAALYRLTTPDVADLFTRLTGGLTLSFLKKGALEEIIQAVAREVHRQYILSFEPASAETEAFHSIRVEMRSRPELKITTRTGYWALQ